MATVKIPIRTKGQTICLHHKGRQLELYCEKCQDLACVKCVATVHQGHLLCDISKFTDRKKGDIRDFVDSIERNELAQIGNYIASTDKLIKDNDRIFDKLASELKMQCDKLKHELDKLTTETLSLYHKMRKDNATLLQKYKQDIEMYAEQLGQQIHECKTVLQYGSHIEICQIECEIDSKTYLPVKPTLRSASFSPNQNPRKHLELALGNVIVTSTDEKSSCTASRHMQSKANREDAVARNKLLTDTKVVGDFWSPYGIKCICPTSDARAWVSYNYSVTLTLLDRKGTAKQKVTHNAVIRDVSLSPTTHRLWACDEERNILEIVSGQFTEMFTTKDAPECLCVSATDHIIVGSSKHVSKYNKQGQIVNATVATVTGKPIVCTPWKITECPVTNNVAVIDNSDEGDGGDGNKLVCVMDVDFQELFVYRGDVLSVSIHTQPVEGTVFDPRDIVYDSQGNIIIADWSSCSIVLLDGVGESLKILHIDKNLPWAVGIGSQSVLWSVFGTYSRGYNVKLLQYSRKNLDMLK